MSSHRDDVMMTCSLPLVTFSSGLVLILDVSIVELVDAVVGEMNIPVRQGLARM